MVFNPPYLVDHVHSLSITLPCVVLLHVYQILHNSLQDVCSNYLDT